MSSPKQISQTEKAKITVNKNFEIKHQMKYNIKKDKVLMFQKKDPVGPGLSEIQSQSKSNWLVGQYMYQLYKVSGSSRNDQFTFSEESSQSPNKKRKVGSKLGGKELISNSEVVDLSSEEEECQIVDDRCSTQNANRKCDRNDVPKLTSSYDVGLLTNLLLDARFTQLGTFIGTNSGQIMILKKGIFFCLKGTKRFHKVSIFPTDICQCLTYFDRKGLSFVFIEVLQQCGVRLRQSLGMRGDLRGIYGFFPAGGPIFDPGSTDPRHRIVTFVFDRISYDQNLDFIHFMDIYKTGHEQAHGSLHRNISKMEADAALIKFGVKLPPALNDIWSRKRDIGFPIVDTEFMLRQKPILSTEMPVKSTVKTTVKKTVEMSVKKTVKTTVKKTVQMPVKKTVETPVKKTVETPVKKTVVMPVKKTVEMPVKKTVETPVKKTVETTVKKTIETSVKKTAETPFKTIVEKHVKKTVETPVETSVMKTVETPVKKIVERTVKSTDITPVENHQKSTSKQVMNASPELDQGDMINKVPIELPQVCARSSSAPEKVLLTAREIQLGRFTEDPVGPITICENGLKFTIKRKLKPHCFCIGFAGITNCFTHFSQTGSSYIHFAVSQLYVDKIKKLQAEMGELVDPSIRIITLVLDKVKQSVIDKFEKLMEHLKLCTNKSESFFMAITQYESCTLLDLDILHLKAYSGDIGLLLLEKRSESQKESNHMDNTVIDVDAECDATPITETKCPEYSLNENVNDINREQIISESLITTVEDVKLGRDTWTSHQRLQGDIKLTPDIHGNVNNSELTMKQEEVDVDIVRDTHTNAGNYNSIVKQEELEIDPMVGDHHRNYTVNKVELDFDANAKDVHKNPSNTDMTIKDNEQVLDGIVKDTRNSTHNRKELGEELDLIAVKDTHSHFTANEQEILVNSVVESTNVTNTVMLKDVHRDDSDLTVQQKPEIISFHNVVPVGLYRNYSHMSLVNIDMKQDSSDIVQDTQRRNIGNGEHFDLKQDSSDIVQDTQRRNIGNGEHFDLKQDSSDIVQDTQDTQRNIGNGEYTDMKMEPIPIINENNGHMDLMDMETKLNYDNIAKDVTTNKTELTVMTNEELYNTAVVPPNDIGRNFFPNENIFIRFIEEDAKEACVTVEIEPKLTSIDTQTNNPVELILKIT